MYNKYSPIGLFDSGIGGLTIAKSLKDLLPKESIVYYGDTKHFPYGEKTSEEIISYVDNICKILLKYNCKLIVIACNTAYAAIHKHLNKIIDKNIPVINVIDPMIEYIKHNHSKNKIGLITTNKTIHSNIYNDRILKCKSLKKFSSLATPLLAPMIEKGEISNEEKTNSIIKSYLENDILKDIETLILGCTHYYLIKNKIKEFYPKKIKILDASKMTALSAKSVLEKKELLSDKKILKDVFIVSYLTKNFEKLVKDFFGTNTKVKTYIYD